ncbi:hypothetical protein [Hymenobacter negativus]|uniref:Tetratricopeptide repeat protein n=1 Tax=Hymenobacter negativus TaxID=2795026 RepID=A0ABS3QPA3_9BACT|nr:hypothetical protein [Hymenobacter negativus]MBO2013123.1 hypothetical protein [Hymenobacter negativus]
MNNQEHAWQAKLSELVESYDLKGLIEFSQQVPTGVADEWRRDVMESGFMTFYSYLSYDQMCGKLGDWGLEMLDDLIEAAEDFQGAPLRELRAQVLSYRLDEVEATDVDQAKQFALRAIHELDFEIPANRDALVFRARLYHQLAQLDVCQALFYWQLAIEDLRAVGDFSVWILYHRWKQPIDGMPEAQQRVCAEFNSRINEELITQPDRLWTLLDEGIRMQEYQPSDELEKQLSAWLQTALGWCSADAHPQLLRNAGLLLHKQGEIQQRADYLAKAIECFEQFILKEPAHAMEVYYMASVWEDWASLREGQGDSGADYLAKAWNIYQKHEDIVRINFSPLHHYASFLARLHCNEQLTKRPSAGQVIALAVEAEAMGNGYYSGPGMIQVRMAIRNEEAETAIYHLCRLLLRHELCISSEIEKLRHSLTNSVAPAIVNFLDQALLFMEDVSQGYFYSPAFSIEDLNNLSPTETIAAWQQRMAEIRKRRRLEE